jgi:hypothetical protein
MGPKYLFAWAYSIGDDIEAYPEPAEFIQHIYTIFLCY